MLNSLKNRVKSMLAQVSNPPEEALSGCASKIRFEDNALTRQRLNELLRQTPSLPTAETREPVQLS